MILPFVPTIQADVFPHGKASAHPAEYARIRSFLRLADTGRDGRLLPINAEHGEPSVDDPSFARAGERVYKFHFAQVGVDLATGRLMYYSGGQASGTETPAFEPDGNGGDRPLPRALTNAEAGRIAARLYAASGWPGGILVRRLYDLGGSSGTCVEVHYSPTWQGVPYTRVAEMDLDRQTGRLVVFDAPNGLPTPPDSVAAGGTPTQARLAALRVVSAWRGEPLSESPDDPLHLVLAYRPPAEVRAGTLERGGKRPSVDSYGPEHVAAFRAGRAILVYEGTLSDDAGNPYGVGLDARTGLVLWMNDARPDLTGAGGLAPAPKAKPLAVPTAERPWRVATGAKGWNAWTPPAKSALTPTSDPAPAGTNLTLTDGKTAFPATYDAKANLLGIQGKAYRPGPGLASLVKRRAK